MKKGGKGGAHTQSGKEFERKIDLSEMINKSPNYSIKNSTILFRGKHVGQMYSQHKFYSDFIRPMGIDEKSILSRKLLPDGAVYLVNENRLYIIEIKYQEFSGSVDEKLQTCDFKRKQYQKLVMSKGIKVEMIYLLNNWFKQAAYRDSLDYIVNMGCYYYFYEDFRLTHIGLQD